MTAVIEQALRENVGGNIDVGLVVRDTPDKGRGLFTTKIFHKGDFVVEYIGELISQVELRRREAAEMTTSFIFEFVSRDQAYAIDASKESGYMGRLCNHAFVRRWTNGVLDPFHANVKPLVFVVDEVPRMSLIALRNIGVNEEILWDYGDPTPDSGTFPFLARTRENTARFPVPRGYAAICP
jgi:histone-lysine N-methyltransferase SETD8